MLLEINHLEKVFRTRFSKEETRALQDVDFKVEQGEFIAIMGESGSGKTTLLNILATLEKPTNGQVILNGEDITKIKEAKLASFRLKNLGFVFQDFNLRLFEDGFTGYNGHEHQKATGMGLYMTKEVLSSLNLSISVDSKINYGTAVSIHK